MTGHHIKHTSSDIRHLTPANLTSNICYITSNHNAQYLTTATACRVPTGSELKRARQYRETVVAESHFEPDSLFRLLLSASQLELACRQLLKQVLSMASADQTGIVRRYQLLRQVLSDGISCSNRYCQTVSATQTGLSDGISCSNRTVRRYQLLKQDYQTASAARTCIVRRYQLLRQVLSDGISCSGTVRQYEKSVSHTGNAMTRRATAFEGILLWAPCCNST